MAPFGDHQDWRDDLEYGIICAVLFVVLPAFAGYGLACQVWPGLPLAWVFR